jgi:hypothetical protein
MADTEVSGKTAVKDPPSKPDMQKIAADAAQRMSTAAGTGINPQTVPTSGNPSQGCGTGGSGSNVNAAPPGTSPEGYDNITLPGSTGMPNSGIMNIVNTSAASMGCNFNVTPHGGRSGRDSGTQNHPTGNAMDGYLNCGGGGATIAQKQQFISNSVKNGATGIGTYNSGFIHVDNYHKNLAVWGDSGGRESADGWARSAATGSAQDTDAAAANGPQGGAGGQGGECGVSEGGCAPSSTSAPQAAASLAQNKGLQMPTGLQDAMSMMQGGNITGMAQQVASAALGAAGGGITQFLGANALAAPDITSMITQGVAGQVANMGSGILPSIVGNMASSFMSGGGIGSVVGMAQGLLTDKISGFAGQLLNSAAPQLGQFMNMFNSAQGAAGMANQLGQTMQKTLGQAFGNAGELFSSGGLEFNNLSSLPGGTNLALNPYLNKNFEPLNGPLREAIDATYDLVGSPEDLLPQLINQGEMHTYGSMFYDWNGLTTNGFTNFTNHLPGLGADLMNLGRLGDIKDLFRLGTPGQVAQQLLTYNLGYTTGLGDFMAENRLKLSDLSNSENDPMIAEFLSTISDPNVIEQVKINLALAPELEIEHLGELLNPQKLFPISYEYNYFEDLKDLAVQLSMCGNVGNMQTLYDLGLLMLSLEPAYDLDTLYGEAAPYNMADMVDFVDSNAPNGRFHPRGELTIADFIGTAAGYVHTNTLPKIAELTEDLYQNTTYFDDYMTLMETLRDTLQGTYSTPTDVTPPGFGTYSTLDDAVTAIVAAIEAELESAKAAIKLDPDAWDKLNQIESAHFESSAYILHEEKLRHIYGINIGAQNKTEVFVSDGVTTTISLSDLVDSNATFNVFVSGIWQQQGSDYTVNTTNRTITLSSAPAAQAKIAVQYGTGRYNPSVNNATVWQFASNLENFALQTGHGGAAEFLSKITSDDVHGQRIQALLRQARNKERLKNFGLNCTAWDQANSGAEDYTHYISQTSIWTDNVDRAAEVWLQNTQEVNDVYSYQLKKIQSNKFYIQNDIEMTLQNVMRQLLYYVNGNIVASELLMQIYQSEDATSIKIFDREDLLIPYTEDVTNDGYILGGYKEIVSELMKIEGLSSDKFVTPLSAETQKYLKDINLDLKHVVRIIQKVLLMNGALGLGLKEGDYRAIFEMPSVSKILLHNMAMDY